MGIVNAVTYPFARLYRRIELVLFRFFVTILIGITCFIKQERMSHENGILVSGRFRVPDQPDFPENDFFTPGREFPLRLRLSSISYSDDAMKQFRAVALKLSGNRFESPWDLKMNTGRHAIFFTARSFWEFMKVWIAGRKEHYHVFFKKYPTSIDCTNDAYRRNPVSFARLHYHSRNPIGFRSKDGRDFYAKFRMIPAQPGPETGRLNTEDLKEPWNPDRLPGDTRDKNYLKAEFIARLEKKRVKFILQMQLHAVQSGDDPEILNSARRWETGEHPWMDLGHITAAHAMSYEESKLTHYWIGHVPRGTMRILTARSMDDYTSVNYLRLWSIWIQRMRLLSYKIRGMPQNYFG